MPFRVGADYITRVVTFFISDEDILPQYRHSKEGVPAHYFQPTEAVFTFNRQGLVSLIIRGPHITVTGRVHGSKYASWAYPMQRVPEPAASLSEANPPSYIFDMLAALGYDKDGRPVT